MECSGLVAIGMHFNLETVANVTLSFGDTLLIRNNFGNVLTITTERDSNQVTIAPIFVPLYVLATVLSITCAYCCTSHGINPVTIVPKSNYPDSGCLDILPNYLGPILLWGSLETNKPFNLF